MDLMLPGRDHGPDDYEAQSALRTLLESEKLQECGDDDLYARIAEQIEHNQDLLARVAGLVENLRQGKDDGKDADDLLARMDRAFKPRKGAAYG